MKIKNFLLIVLIFYGLKSYPQQDPQFAHNTFNLLYTNSGSAGMLISKDEICATIINNRKWVGFKGAPVTTIANVHKHIKLGDVNGGLGLTILDDRLGFEKNFQAKLSFAYHKTVSSGVLGIGIDAGVLNKDIKASWIPPETSADGDAAIPGAEARKMVFDFGLGAMFAGNNFFAGISSLHINQSKVKFPLSETAYFLRRHFYLTAGYNVRFKNTPIELKPSIHYKFDGTKLQHSYNLTGLYNKRFWLGVTYRNIEAIIPMGGIKLNSGITIGYAYELPLTKMLTYSKGTHEVMIGYCFGFFRVPKNYKAKGVRYF